MKLNHLDLQVSDVHAARAFFETHFGLRCAYSRRDEMALMDDEIGFSLALSNLGQNAAPTYPPDFHIGFVFDEASQVEELYDRFKSEGIAMKMGIQQGGPNLYFVCLGPDSIPVEVRAPIK